jgi:dihydrofolate synthase/folylpolyglutamate synthase
MQSRSLAEWLSYQERLHPNVIDLGLDRLSRVLERLQWSGLACPVITVAGTNGKGSCVALLDSMLSAATYRVGAFTSPHLIRYNERIRVAGREVSDAQLIAAFERIEAARGDVSITFFEFNTLAALLIFAAEKPDVVLLEVGLGGKLDAVNVVDADVAIVTSIGLDHCEWLGQDLESIARWKAGIFRSARPAIFGAREMPSAIEEEARRIGAELLRLGTDFDFAIHEGVWDWSGRQRLSNLPLPALFGGVQLDNSAAALTALECLQSRLPTSQDAIEAGLRAAALPGRFQLLKSSAESKIEWLLDVAHNPAAALTLQHNLSARTCSGKSIAVFGVLADKDIDGVIAAVQSHIDVWVIASLSGSRAIAADVLAAKVWNRGGNVAFIAPNVVAACGYAQSIAADGDRIVVFGSFHTVGPALEWLNSTPSQ